MKKTVKTVMVLMLICIICILSVSCTDKTPQENGLWKDAAYTEDTVLGNGEKKFELEVQAEDKSVTFTINTDADNLEDALTEHKLIEGEEGPYGLYVKTVNGITADYDTDQSYWSLCLDGSPLQTGVGGTAITGGEHFEFIHTK